MFWATASFFVKRIVSFRTGSHCSLLFFADRAVLSLAELGTVTWQIWQCAGMLVQRQWRLLQEHNKCACKTAGVFYDANFLVVEVILDTAASWHWYSVLGIKVYKWTIEKFLYGDVYLAVLWTSAGGSCNKFPIIISNNVCLCRTRSAFYCIELC